MLGEKLKAVIEKADLADAVHALVVTIATAIMAKSHTPGDAEAEVERARQEFSGAFLI